MHSLLLLYTTGSGFFLVQTQAQKFTPIPSNGELLYRPKDVERITSMFYPLKNEK